MQYRRFSHGFTMSLLRFYLFTLVCNLVFCDNDLPPPPPPGIHGGGPGPGSLGYGGLFPGFFKNLDVNYGFGPGVGGIPFGGDLGDGGLGGLGGLLGGGGGLPFGGLLGPSYIPQTWIGSALGAKYDLLFPIVMFVFFVVGVWTVVQLLLGFIVPLIASKLALKSAFIKRDAGQDKSDLDIITHAVLSAINNPKCVNFVACNSGNFVHRFVGGKHVVKDYQTILDGMDHLSESKSLGIFKSALLSGELECGEYACDSLS